MRGRRSRMDHRKILYSPLHEDAVLAEEYEE
jgi:hypothetical protein